LQHYKRAIPLESRQFAVARNCVLHYSVIYGNTISTAYCTSPNISVIVAIVDYSW